MKKNVKKFCIILAVELVVFVTGLVFFPVIGSTYKFDELSQIEAKNVASEKYAPPALVDTIAAEKQLTTAIITSEITGHVYAALYTRSGVWDKYTLSAPRREIFHREEITAPGRGFTDVTYTVEADGTISEYSIVPAYDTIISRASIIIGFIFLAYWYAFVFEKRRAKKKNEQEYAKQRQITKSFAEMAREEKEGREKNQKDDTK